MHDYEAEATLDQGYMEFDCAVTTTAAGHKLVSGGHYLQSHYGCAQVRYDVVLLAFCLRRMEEG